jgi:molecular chaperone DnaK (HSP70)
MAARYVVGIDLGTTNCALAWAEIESEVEALRVENFEIPQLIELGTIESQPTLPSFHFQPLAAEFSAGSLDLPWSKDRGYALGIYARQQGASQPDRLIASSKSWLCHAGVDRRAAFLPLREADESGNESGAESENEDSEEKPEQLSPVEVARRLLEHLRDAWNASERGSAAPLADQEVFLTVPASFDAVARELTIEAARKAGLGEVVLLEEPLAAFYSWLHRRGEEWRKDLKVGERVLVCDVGGGTTDFSLIEAQDESGELVLDRVAVGEHILLGGDNMDLTLAHVVAQKLKVENPKLRLDPWQSRILWHQCREAKEGLLADAKLEEARITLLSRGSKLIGKTIKSTLTRAEVEAALVDGFFPKVGVHERPAEGGAEGLEQRGLPYAADAAVTKHIAAFLDRSDGLMLPNAVLMNGGVFKGQVLCDRLMSVLGAWCAEAKEPAPRLLLADNLDLAVATGAAYYGLVRRGKGIRVRGGAARSYYLGIKSNLPAVPGMPAPLKFLCVVPFGMEYGSRCDVPGPTMSLNVGESKEFRLFSSVREQGDRMGRFCDPEDLSETAPLRADIATPDLETGSRVPIKLQVELTEVGSLELRCVSLDGAHEWKLSFDIRAIEDS